MEQQDLFPEQERIRKLTAAIEKHFEQGKSALAKVPTFAKFLSVFAQYSAALDAKNDANDKLLIATVVNAIDRAEALVETLKIARDLFLAAEGEILELNSIHAEHPEIEEARVAGEIADAALEEEEEAELPYSTDADDDDDDPRCAPLIDANKPESEDMELI